MGIQLDLEAMVRIYTRVATPQRFGVRIVWELSDILTQEEVRKALDIPNFDRIVVRPSSHSPLEADVTLFSGKRIVGRYSVKASPTGNIDYIVESWRRERTDLDLLAIVPLEGKKGNEEVFFIAMIRISKILKGAPPKRIKEYIRSALEAKREGEGLERLWLTDFAELSNAIRDFAIIKKQDELLKKQDELLRMQSEFLVKQEESLKRQGESLRKQDELLRMQSEFLVKQEESLRKQDELLQKQDIMIDLLKKILEVLGEIKDKLG